MSTGANSSATASWSDEIKIAEFDDEHETLRDDMIGATAAAASRAPDRLSPRALAATAFDNLSEAVMLNNIRGRFAKRQIYTFVGDVLLSINPYEARARAHTALSHLNVFVFICFFVDIEIRRGLRRRNAEQVPRPCGAERSVRLDSTSRVCRRSAHTVATGRRTSFQRRRWPIRT